MRRIHTWDSLENRAFKFFYTFLVQIDKIVKQTFFQMKHVYPINRL